jgi:uncharacterized membrane protein YdfJ with MMPL/SSD domain
MFKTVHSACLIALTLLPAFPALAKTKGTYLDNDNDILQK